MRTATPRTLITAAACSALFLTASGCGNDPEPTPTTSTSPSPSKSAWESKFTEQQKAEYAAALSRFTEYEQSAQPIWSTGKATDAAQGFFEDYWALPIVPMAQLRNYEKFKITTSGLPKVISSEPSRVLIRKKVATVDIKQCVDPTTIKVHHAPGAKLTQPQKGPYYRTITLSHPIGGSPYMILGIADLSNTKKVEPCGP